MSALTHPYQTTPVWQNWSLSFFLGISPLPPNFQILFSLFNFFLLRLRKTTSGCVRLPVRNAIFLYDENWWNWPIRMRKTFTLIRQTPFSLNFIKNSINDIKRESFSALLSSRVYTCNSDAIAFLLLLFQFTSMIFYSTLDSWNFPLSRFHSALRRREARRIGFLEKEGWTKTRSANVIPF